MPVCYWQKGRTKIKVKEARRETMMPNVLFDTCGKRWEGGIWYMMENGRVAAFHEAMHAVERLDLGDIVFFWHPGHGLVAAARVVGPVHPDGQTTLYRDVEFVTPIPMRGQELRAMPYAMVCEITGIPNFFMAAIIKNPPLNVVQAENLIQELTTYLQALWILLRVEASRRPKVAFVEMPTLSPAMMLLRDPLRKVLLCHDPRL